MAKKYYYYVPRQKLFKTGKTREEKNRYSRMRRQLPHVKELDRLSRLKRKDIRTARHNARRAAKKGSQNEVFLNSVVFERDGYVCGLCGKKIDKRTKNPHPKSASLDHIIPISLGGSHTLNNVQCAHLGCNLSKCNKNIGQLILDIF